MSEFLDKLRELLPPDCITINGEGLAVYFDWHGVTFGKTMEEQAVADKYVADVIAEKVGYPVRITLEEHAGNGHFAVSFERAAPAADQK